MGNDIKIGEEWEEISNDGSASETSEYCSSDNVQLGELLTRMSIWTEATVRKMEIMSGKRRDYSLDKVINRYILNVVKFS